MPPSLPASDTTATPTKTALITGQDGSWLAELLLKKGYIVN